MIMTERTNRARLTAHSLDAANPEHQRVARKKPIWLIGGPGDGQVVSSKAGVALLYPCIATNTLHKYSLVAFIPMDEDAGGKLFGISSDFDSTHDVNERVTLVFDQHTW